MNVAVILSAGSGSRFGSDIPKQFINLAGKNIIEYTIAAFEQNSQIDEICIVADIDFHKKLSLLAKDNNFSKVKKIIQGGKERKDSSYNAIKEYSEHKNVNLIFHDAVRPFVSQEIIDQCIKALKSFDAVDVAIPTADTIIQIDEASKTIESIPQRSKLQRGQTPQAFKLETIKQAHELANKDANEPLFTDDCGLVKQYLPDNKIYIVDGEEKNIKITYPEDLLFAEKLIQLSSYKAIEQDFKKLKDKVVVVFGGNSGIGDAVVKLAVKYNAIAIPLSRQNGLDITCFNNLITELEKIKSKYGKIDVVINSAGVLTKKELKNFSESEILEEININLLGAINVAKASYEYLKASTGSLILFTSSSYTRGRKEYSVYSATKAAVVNLTQALAEEWQEDEIKVNVICPARTDTPMRLKSFGAEDQATLLTAESVAEDTLKTALSEFSGLVIDVKLGIDS